MRMGWCQRWWWCCSIDDDDDDDDDDDGMERIRSGVPLIFVCPTAGTLPSNSFPLASAPQPRHFIHLIQSTLSSISSSDLSSTLRSSFSSISSSIYQLFLQLATLYLHFSTYLIIHLVILRLEICQKIYMTGFSGQNFYTLKVRNCNYFYSQWNSINTLISVI